MRSRSADRRTATAARPGAARVAPAASWAPRSVEGVRAAAAVGAAAVEAHADVTRRWAAARRAEAVVGEAQRELVGLTVVAELEGLSVFGRALEHLTDAWDPGEISTPASANVLDVSTAKERREKKHPLHENKRQAEAPSGSICR